MAMGNNTYTLVTKFNCCGKTMATVIIKGKAACVMPELEYNRIMEAQRKTGKAG
jgi:predicted nucleic acid-binding Zn finger protein